MKTLAALAAAAALALPALPASAGEKPVRVAYYYKVRWGFQQEFERLFLKNHHPLLLAQRKDGRIRSVNLYRPTFHGDGRADWTFLVIIEFGSWAALGAPSNEEALARELFPDQETFRKEEQRRFEILDAHWDVPLAEVVAPPS
ncbi:MAG TPA: hypothetical protein VLI67_03010 [Vicinamibacteria bacterium]|nr:hypothetical protein [Vicinamibacteria bacterium]